jgi:hypothetical protein
MSDSLVAKKKKPKVEKPSATTLAFREYERVSYYLATQSVFDFGVDDTAREAFFNDDGMTINACIANRLAPESDGPSYKIPKGDHIVPGLQVRTDERVSRKLKQDKPKPEPKEPTRKKSPKLPLVKSGNPGLAAEADSLFGGGS